MDAVIKIANLASVIIPSSKDILRKWILVEKSGTSSSIYRFACNEYYHVTFFKGSPLSPSGSTFLPFAKFRFAAPEAIKLGTGKRSSSFLEVPLSVRQFTRQMAAFDTPLSFEVKHMNGCHVAGSRHSAGCNLVGVTASYRPTNKYLISQPQTGHSNFTTCC
jgi:hypothetical protein